MREMELEEFTKDKSFPFFIQYGKQNCDFFQHTHKDFIELLIVIDGYATHLVNHESYAIKKGDVFVIGSNTSHNFINCQHFRLCNIMFHPYFLYSIDADIKKTAGFQSLFVNDQSSMKDYVFKNKLKLTDADYDKIKDILDVIMDEYEYRNDGWNDMIKYSFMRLVILLSRIYEITPRMKGADLILIANAAAYMETHFAEPIALKKLAEIANISERHFTRVFLDTYHTTPLQYIVKLRLAHAYTLLEDSTLTITEVSNRCGFSDNNYFARKFKSIYHCSPSELRRRNS